MSKLPLAICDTDAKTIKITFKTIKDNIGIHDDIIIKFLVGRSVCSLVMGLTQLTESKNTGNNCNCKSDTNTCECDATVLNLIINELTRRWYELTVDDIHEGGYQLVNAFLKTDNFSHSNVTEKQKEGLENFLARMIYHYFKGNPDASTDQFKYLFDMLHYDNLSLYSISCLVKIPQCLELCELYPDFSAKLLKILISCLDIYKGCLAPEHSQKYSRFPKPVKLVNVSKIETSLSTICFDDIKVGDKFDVKDKRGDWYAAKVVSVTESNVTVFFDGWGDGNNEIFTKNTYSDKFLKFGTLTNEISHENGNCGRETGCRCYTCTVKIISM